MGGKAASRRSLNETPPGNQCKLRKVPPQLLHSRNAAGGCGGKEEPTYIRNKELPVQIQRRLAAVGDVVYCTPGDTAPTTVFDAATGAVIKKHTATAGTMEFVYDRGVLYVVTGDQSDISEAHDDLSRSALNKSMFQREAYGPTIRRSADPKNDILAVDAESGNQLWRISAVSLVLSDRAVYLADSARLRAFRLADGRTLWETPATINHHKPLSCACCHSVMLNGFNAMAAEPGLTKSDQPIKVGTEATLEEGIAFSEIENLKSPTSDSPGGPPGSIPARAVTRSTPARRARRRAPASELSSRPLKQGKIARARNRGASNVAPSKKLWSSSIPLTGKAIVLADDVLFVAGTPVVFPKGDLPKAYEGRMGGILWAASASTGEKLAQYKLDAPPAWDGLAAAGGMLFLSLADGRVVCMGPRTDRLATVSSRCRPSGRRRCRTARR